MKTTEELQAELEQLDQAAQGKALELLRSRTAPTPINESIDAAAR